MTSQTLTIKGELTDLNRYIDAERSNRYAGASIKKRETEKVAWSCVEQKLKPIHGPVGINCTWYTPDERKDADNVAFATKFILDGMVEAGILQGDGRKFVHSFMHTFRVDKLKPRVEVLIAIL